MRRRALFAILIACTSAIPLVARAETASWQLEWVAPKECPDATRVRESVARLLGSGRRGDDAVSARIVVSHDDGGFHAQVDTVQRAGGGHRSLDGRTCQDVADASALIVALLVDPNVLAPPPASAAAADSVSSSTTGTPSTSGSEGTEETSKPGTDGSATAPAATAAAAPTPTPRAPPTSSVATVERRPRVEAAPGASSRASAGAPWFAAADVAAGLGTVPGLGLGLGLTLGYRLGRVRVALEGIYWPSETSALPNRAPAGGSVGLAAGGASGCFAVFHRARVDAGPCVAFELGRMSATGVNLPSGGGGEGAAFWAAAAAGGYVSLLVLPPFALSLEAYAWVPLATPRFQVEQAGVAFEPSPVEGRSILSLEVRF